MWSGWVDRGQIERAIGARRPFSMCSDRSSRRRQNVVRRRIGRRAPARPQKTGSSYQQHLFNHGERTATGPPRRGAVPPGSCCERRLRDACVPRPNPFRALVSPHLQRPPPSRTSSGSATTHPTPTLPLTFERPDHRHPSLDVEREARDSARAAPSATARCSGTTSRASRHWHENVGLRVPVAQLLSLQLLMPVSGCTCLRTL